MSKDDFAIVVGIRRYPRFGRSDLEGDDLLGPDNDAAAIYDWLIDPAGGDVPKTHIWRIQSADFADPFKPPDDAQPTTQDVIRAFSRVEAKAQKNLRDGRGLSVGRRLYVYFAGHGFAPGLKQGAVFTADATRELTFNFYVSSWVEALYARQYFSEYVLWMDSCMTFELAVVATPAPYTQRAASGPPPQLFTAFAARKPQETVEKQMPDGLVHGVFTWTLLQGLQGAAPVDAAGQLTTAQLKNYMILGMRTLLGPEELNDDRVSQTPDFGSEDPIVFPAAPPRLFKVVLKFSAGSAAKPLVLIGNGLNVVASGPIPANPMELQLGAGMYAAVADGKETGFQVVGDTVVDVS